MGPEICQKSPAGTGPVSRTKPDIPKRTDQQGMKAVAHPVALEL